MTEIQNGSGIGQVQIADEVIAVIAGTAALEIDGVAAMSGNITGDLAEMLGRKSLSKGVRVEVNESTVVLTLTVLVKFGFKVQEVCQNIQARVKTAVETMTGLTVSQVDVMVSGVFIEKDKQKENPGRAMDHEL